MSPRRRLTGKETPLELYKQLLDLIVARRPSMWARWIHEDTSFGKTKHSQSIDAALRKLSTDERAIIADLLQHERDGGIHDTLVVLSEESNLNGLRFVQGGTELPNEPFGTELFYDFVARREGDDWPDSTTKRA